MSFRVFPYKQGSASAKKLSNALDGKVLKINGSKYRPKRGDVVINWGASNPPVFAPATTLNPDVSDAQCKKKSLIKLHQAGVRVPDFVTEGADRLNGRQPKEDAAQLGFPVVCRTKLRGHSGDGIVIANNAEELVDAPLYTKYVKKKDEYRVHVFGDNVFFVQRKARKLDVEQPNWMVRNLAGGFVFVEVPGPDGNRKNFECPNDVLVQATAAIKALGLDFGGVDVMWNERERQAYVLEVNTACGLEERTAERYRQAIMDNLPDRG